MKKSFSIGLIALGLFFFPCPSQVNAADSVLGISKTQWQQDLPAIGGEYKFSDKFVPEMEQSQNDLKQRYSTSHFEKLDSQIESPKEKRRNNSLLQSHPQKVRSKFMLDLSLNKSDYSKLVKYIPWLGTYYGEDHIAKILPYLAMCINYDIPANDLNFYIRDFLKRETPVDIVCDRLYWLATQQNE